MQHYVFYDIATGAAVARIMGPPGIAEMQVLEAGQGFVEISADAYNHRVALANIDVGEIRAALWEYAKSVRDAHVLSGAQTSHGVVDTKAYSLAMLTVKRTLAAAVNPDTEMSFTMADNSVVTMFADDLVEMIDEALTWVDSIHNHARALRQTLDAAETTTAALQVDVFRGWPVITPVETEEAPEPEQA